MTELDVINEMLATMGEAPLNQLDEDHPYVAAGRRFLSTTSQRVQSRGWWFNTEYLQLHPDAVSGFVYVPKDVLSCESVRGTCRYRYTQRGRRLYDTDNGTYEIGESPVHVKAIRNVPFEDLPALAQDAIAMASVLRFQRNYDADGNKTGELAADQSDAIVLLTAEHTRQMKANLLNTGSAASKMAAVGPINSRRLPYPGWGVGVWRR